MVRDLRLRLSSRVANDFSYSQQVYRESETLFVSIFCRRCSCFFFWFRCFCAIINLRSLLGQHIEEAVPAAHRRCAGLSSSPSAHLLVFIIDVERGFAGPLVELALLRIPGACFPTICAIARRGLCIIDINECWCFVCTYERHALCLFLGGPIADSAGDVAHVFPMRKCACPSRRR